MDSTATYGPIDEAPLHEAEERWRMLAEHHPDPISITVGGRIVFINPAAARMLGARNVDDIIGRSIRDFVPQDEVRAWRSRYGRRCSQKYPGRMFESQIRRLDGSYCPVEFNSCFVLYNGARAVQAIFRDITERKQAEYTLRQNEKMLRSVIMSAPILLFAMDREGIITLSEGRAVYSLGLAPGQLVGYNGLELYGHLPGARENMERVLDGEEVHTVVPILDRTFEAWYSPIEGADGSIEGLSGVALDITDRRKAEAALERVESRMKALFEYALDAIILADDDGSVIEANPAACRLLGYNSEEIRDLRLQDIMPSLVPWAFQDGTDAPNYRIGREVAVRRRDGRLLEVEYHVAADMPGLHMAVLRDITEQRGAEVALRKSEERFATTFMVTPVAATLTTFTNGRIVAVNDIFCEVSGYSRDEIVGSTISDLNILAEPSTRAELLNRIRPEGGCRNMDMKLRTRAGEIRDMLLSAVVMEFGGETCLLSMYNDVTERRKMEHEILEISEKERRRIGQDLHDGLGSHLTGIAMLSRGLAYRSERGETIPAAELDEIARLAVSGVEQARALARGLNPIKLEARGLIPALEELVRTTGRNTGIECEFKTSAGAPRIGIDACVQLYRITQEALSNAVRHARPSKIVVNLKHMGREVSLTIHDDGNGMPGEQTNSEGMGIRIMKHRANMIGSTLIINSTPGKGTAVSCRLALSGQNDPS